MTNRIVKFLVPTVLGVLTTIAVAWSPAFGKERWEYESVDWVRSDPGQTGLPPGLGQCAIELELYEEAIWDAASFEIVGGGGGFGGLPFSGRPRQPEPGENFLPSYISSTLSREMSTRAEVGRISFDYSRYGFPFRCLSISEYRARNDTEMFADDIVETNALTFLNGEIGDEGIVRLPIAPVITGSLGNVAIYSAVWWLVLIGPFAARRRLRRRIGRCPKCAYDLTRDFEAGCPECGWNRD